MQEIFDCIVVGCGQTGLYLAHQLQCHDVSYLVLEAGVVGQAWKDRPPSLQLFTSRAFAQLPDYALDGDIKGYPSAQELSLYLDDYAQYYQISVLDNTVVQSCTQKNRVFEIETMNGHVLYAKTVVDCTGPNQKQYVPQLSEKLSSSVIQLTPKTKDIEAQLMNCNQLLVVGDGATGRQMSVYYSQYTHVVLSQSARRSRALVPNVILKQDLFWWLNHLGVLFADKNSLVGRLIQARNPVPLLRLNDKKIVQKGIRLVGRLEDIVDDVCVLSCGASLAPDAIYWATGYREDNSWIQLDILSSNGEVVHDQGSTAQQGFFVLGRKWLSCRASELILGVAHDTALVLPKILQYLQSVDHVSSHVQAKDLLKSNTC